MSVAYYIVLDTEEPGFDTFVNGKAIAHAADELETLCERLNLPALDAFMGQSLDELADMLGENMDLEDEDSGEQTWFEPQAGIDLVDALVAAIRENPAEITDADAVIEDFAEYKTLLEQAQAIRAKWHLALDF